MTEPTTTSSSQQALRFYRFRSVDALIGPRAELANQEIFFADPGSLNDPMEGFKDIVWRGDAIAWRNHLRHYLLCLTQTVATLQIMGPDYDAVGEHDFSASTPARLPTPLYRSIFDQVSDAFFRSPEVAAYPSQLAGRGAIRREELLYYLKSLHPHALQVILTVFGDRELCAKTVVGIVEGWGAEPLDATFFDTLAAASAEGPEDIASQLFASFQSLSDQQQILRLDRPDDLPAGWSSLLFDFADAYINRLQGLMQQPWYAACFVGDFRHPAMWGHYGDSHRGVCLEFKAERNAAGAPVLPLRQINGWSAPNGRPEPTTGLVRHEFKPVQYASRYPELDFFSSMGRLTVADLAFWFMAPDGARSAAGAALFEDSDQWRKAYWSRHLDALATKLEGWRHEAEHRLILTSVLTNFREPATRKLAYDLDNLASVTFGLKTAPSDKAEIVRIIRDKRAKTPGSDFAFYQAYYSRRTGQIERQTLTLC